MFESGFATFRDFLQSTWKRVTTWFCNDLSYIKFMRTQMPQGRFMEREVTTLLKKTQLSDTDLDGLFTSTPIALIIKKICFRNQPHSFRLNLLRSLAHAQPLPKLGMCHINDLMDVLPSTDESLARNEDFTGYLLHFLLRFTLPSQHQSALATYIKDILPIVKSPTLKTTLMVCAARLLLGKGTVKLQDSCDDM